MTSNSLLKINSRSKCLDCLIKFCFETKIREIGLNTRWSTRTSLCRYTLWELHTLQASHTTHWFPVRPSLTCSSTQVLAYGEKWQTPPTQHHHDPLYTNKQYKKQKEPNYKFRWIIRWSEECQGWRTFWRNAVIRREVLNALKFFTQEFLYAVRVPLEDAEFFSDVPVIVQQL